MQQVRRVSAAGSTPPDVSAVGNRASRPRPPKEAGKTRPTRLAPRNLRRLELAAHERLIRLESKGIEMVRIARTDLSLREASKAVDYDLNMMGNTLQAMLQSNVGIDSLPEERLVANAMLHSFLLATRNLCKFLYSYKPYPNDIIAEDFFDNADDWKKLRPASVPEFEEGSLAGMISARLLHLTYERAEGTKPTWGGFRIAWELRKSLEVFVARVKPERLSEELVEDAATMLRVLQRYVDEHGSVDDVQSAPLSMLWAEEDFWLNRRPVDSDTDEGT